MIISSLLIPCVQSKPTSTTTHHHNHHHHNHHRNHERSRRSFRPSQLQFQGGIRQTGQYRRRRQEEKPLVWLIENIRGGGGLSSSSSSSSSWKSSPWGVQQQQQQQQSRGFVDQQQQQQQQLQQQQQQQQQQQETKELMDAFLTRDCRNSFIARVYSILSCQLLVTAGSIGLFGTQASVRKFMHLSEWGPWIPIVSTLVSTMVWFIICTIPRARRQSPIKWQLLSLFTLGESIAIGYLSSFFRFQTVFTSMIMTALATSTVSLYTILQTNPKYDLSQWGQTLSACGMIFVGFGILQLLQITGILPFLPVIPYNDLLYSFIGSCLFAAFLAYHTKMIVSGKHTKYQMNEKDYVFASMTLYLDIINIFIYILRIIGEDRDSSSR